MWVYAFFASKKAVNRIDDRAWAERAETICARANDRAARAGRLPRSIDEPATRRCSPNAAIVDQATDILERMLDEVVAVEPSDEQGPGARAALGGLLPHVPRQPPRLHRRAPRRSTPTPSARPWSTIPLSDLLETSPPTTRCPRAPAQRPRRPDAAGLADRLRGPASAVAVGRRITAGRVADGDAVVRQLAAHDRVGADDDVAADRRPGQHHRAVAEPRAVADRAPGAPASSGAEIGRSRSS